MNWKEITAKYVLGLLSSDDLAAIGMEAIVVGYDSPSLRQLAGRSGDSEETDKLFLRTMRELNVKIPLMSEAGIQVARHIARDILAKKIQPYEGAKQIWDIVYTRLPELKELRPFVGLASEYEDDVQHREAYSLDIISECEKLLKN
jgi:hypothetical protein